MPQFFSPVASQTDECGQHWCVLEQIRVSYVLFINPSSSFLLRLSLWFSLVSIGAVIVMTGEGVVTLVLVVVVVVVVVVIF